MINFKCLLFGLSSSSNVAYSIKNTNTNHNNTQTYTNTCIYFTLTTACSIPVNPAVAKTLFMFN